MLVKISWRNIWRNRQRSTIMVLAIAAGLWGGVFAAAILLGMIDQRFRTGIEQEFSHVQIHHPEFIKEQNSIYMIDKEGEITAKLAGNPAVEAFSGRTVVFGMVASANQSTGIKILGVDPEMEASTTRLNANIIEGTYLEVGGRNPLMIGKSLADKLNVNVGSRLVLTFQNLDNELVSVSARIAGIFQTANSMFDESNVFMLQSDISSQLGGATVINEVAIVLTDYRLSKDFAQSLADSWPGLTVRNWAEISPSMAYMHEMGTTMFMVILVIILLALAFGLLNTMIMSVFERVKELGMLMSIGMNKKRVFSMILIETVFLTVTGAVIGMIAGLSAIALTARKGIDLTAVGGESLGDFGFEPVVYPSIELSMFFSLTVLIILTAIAVGIYPALKAIRLKPFEAVRGD